MVYVNVSVPTPLTTTLTCHEVPLAAEERHTFSTFWGSGLTKIDCVPWAGTVPLAGRMTAHRSPALSCSTALARQLTATVLRLLSSVSDSAAGCIPWL